MAKGVKTGGRTKGTPNKPGPKKKRKPTPKQMAAALAKKLTGASAPDEVAGGDVALDRVTAVGTPEGCGAPPAATYAASGAPVDPKAVLLELCGWAMDEFRRVRDLPGGRETILNPNGGRTEIVDAAHYAKLARQFAADTLPYEHARVSPVDGSRSGIGKVIVKVQRQGEYEEITVGVAA